MDNLIIDAQTDSPKIILDAQNNKISICGPSYPENTVEFYQPVKLWLKKYFKSITNTTIIELELPYINSSSFRVFFEIFEIFETACEKGNDIRINWIYDENNDIAKETGEDFIEDFEILNIQLVKK